MLGFRTIEDLYEWEIAMNEAVDEDAGIGMEMFGDAFER